MVLKTVCSLNRCSVFSKCIASTFLSRRHQERQAGQCWEFLVETAVHWTSCHFWHVSSCTWSQVEQIFTEIQKYILWILKELYTTFLRHRLIGCLRCHSREKTSFKSDRYWDERPLGWKHFKRQCFRLRIVGAQFLTKALHNKIYISIWCNVMFWNLSCVKWCIFSSI